MNETTVEARAEDVYAVLEDFRTYEDWVVGSKRARDGEESFPETGTAFWPVVGVGPLMLRAQTKALRSEPPRRIVLEISLAPLVVARVDVGVDELDEGRCLVSLEERPVGGLLALPVLRRVSDVLVKARNVESLRRLARLSEERARSTSGR